MIVGVRQASFAAGEISPSLFGRTDFAKYDIGLRKCRNWIVTPQGSLINRSGTRYIGTTKTTGKKVRLIPFIFSKDQAFICEFGDLYVRFYQNGSLVMSGQSAYEVTTPYVEADLPKLKFAQVGDIITITHQNYEPRELRRYGTTNWTLVEVFPKQKAGFYPHWTDQGLYQAGDRVLYWNGAINTVFTVYEALVDVSVYDPPSYPAKWKEVTDRKPPQDASLGYVVQDANSRRWEWVITSVGEDGTESPPCRPLTPPINVGTPSYSFKATLSPSAPATITWTKSLMTKVRYWRVYRGQNGIYGWVGDVDLSSVTYLSGVMYPTLACFDDEGISPDYAQPPPLYTSPPFLVRRFKPFTHYKIGDIVQRSTEIYQCIGEGTSGRSGPTGTGTSIQEPATAPGWATATAYVVGDYVVNAGVLFRCISNHTSSGTVGPWGQGWDAYAGMWRAWNDGGITQGYLRWQAIGPVGPVTWKYLRQASDIPSVWSPYPAVVNYYEQRRIFANTQDRPAGVWMSRTGKYADFDAALVPVATDSVNFDLASRNYEEIKGLATIRVLGALTSMGQWAISGGAGPGTPITPSSIYAKSQLVYPSGWLDPLVVGNVVLYVQDKSNVIRDLTYTFIGDSYASADLTVISSHLFWAHQIKAWCYQQTPFGVVWTVREDGKLVALTYQKDQEVLAWHWHDTKDGYFEDVACIPEGDEDAVYVVVLRGTARYIERLTKRIWGPRTVNGVLQETPDVADGVFLDSSLSYNGMPATTFSGLTHLEGKEVMVLADGYVAGPYTVASGAINIVSEFPDGASVVHVGLQIQHDIEFLPPKIGPDIKRSNLKLLPRISFEVANSRGAMRVGIDYTNMRAWRQREVKDSYGTIVPYTGLDHLRLPSGYTHDVPLCIRHDEPLPINLLAVDREIDLGGD